MRKASHPKAKRLVQLISDIVGDTRESTRLPPKHFFVDLLQELLFKAQSHFSDFSGHITSTLLKVS